MSDYKHYIRVENGIVIHGFSDAFEQPQSGDIQLSGDFGRHFQFNLLTYRLQFKYKIVNGQMVERTQEELNAELDARPPEPKSDKELLAQARQDIGRLNRTIDSLSYDVQAIIDTIVV